MKTIKIFLLFIFYANLSFGQQYFKIPTDSNYYWRQRSICQSYNYQIKYSKDTIINGIIYNKYSTFGSASGGEPCTSYLKHGFLRQDTLNKTVVVLDHNFSERPLYNFSKVLGDTMLVYNKALDSNVLVSIVHVTTGILYDGSQRKVMWTSKNNCFIEGMGSIFSGLYGSDQVAHSANSNYNTEELICFGTINPYKTIQEGKTQMDHDCNLIGINDNLVSTNDNRLISIVVTIFPNPVKNKITIESEALDFLKIEIVSVLGQIIFTKDDILTKEVIDLTAFPAGIYFLKVNDRKTTSTFKIIKE